jgi:hypothetical protein
MAEKSGKTRYLPGDAVPQSGIYRVLHKNHRAAHENSFLAGQRFPQCRICRQEVRFDLIQGEQGRAGRSKVN